MHEFYPIKNACFLTSCFGTLSAAVGRGGTALSGVGLETPRLRGGSLKGGSAALIASGGKIERSSAGRKNYKYSYRSKHVSDERGFKAPWRREIRATIGHTLPPKLIDGQTRGNANGGGVLGVTYGC